MGFGIALVLGGCVALPCGATRAAGSEEPAAARGAALYQAQCALCHGGSGEADGPVSYLLFPPPRDFTRGRFKLAGTINGIPSDEDLVATLRRGIPGSSMPAWSWVADGDLRALAGHVRELAVAGIVEELRSERDAPEDELWTAAREWMTPGAPLDVGHPAEPTTANLQLGMRLYLVNCAGCHGEEGKGRPDVLRPDEDDTLNWARDFTAGILKGGATHEELVKRVEVGMHGTAMPAARLDREERSAVIAFVRTLIPQGAEDRLVQRRETIQVKRAPEGGLARAGSIDWNGADEVDVALAPLWWRDGAILRARIAALHDGGKLAVRIRWRDPTTDAPTDLEWPLDAPPYADGVALQLSPEDNPPFFGMGSAPSTVNIWHWRAIDVPDAEDLRVALTPFPHRVGEWLAEGARERMPLYQIAGESVPPSIAAYPKWASRSWEVVFTRALEPRMEREIPLRPGARVSVNFAIWNGSIRDLRGQKSVTLWHRLELEP